MDDGGLWGMVFLGLFYVPIPAGGPGWYRAPSYHKKRNSSIVTFITLQKSLFHKIL